MTLLTYPSYDTETDPWVRPYGIQHTVINSCWNVYARLLSSVARIRYHHFGYRACSICFT